MWTIPDDDGDNIPGKTPHHNLQPDEPLHAGVGGNDYPVNGLKELCALNPANPGC